MNNVYFTLVGQTESNGLAMLIIVLAVIIVLNVLVIFLALRLRRYFLEIAGPEPEEER